MAQIAVKLHGTTKVIEIIEPADALGHLIQWAIGNRGGVDTGRNPFSIPEIKLALQSLANAHGWNHERIALNWYDAADAYRCTPDNPTGAGRS